MIKKISCCLYTLLLMHVAFSQYQLPDNFTIGNFFEVFHNDSLKIYYNCTGTITDKKCAAYYRVGKMDPVIINVTGTFYDCTPDGHVMLTAKMVNNLLEDSAQYYYNNGVLKETGLYHKNIREGRWLYNYPNGQREKVVNFINGEVLVEEAFSRDGDTVVVGGAGYFHTQFRGYKQCAGFNAWGPVANGRRDGNWTYSIDDSNVPIAVETYLAGQFVESRVGKQLYQGGQKISFDFFYPAENLNLIDNLIGCPGQNFTWPLYKNAALTARFYPDLLEQLQNYKALPQDQWLVIGIQISAKNKLAVVNVASSVNDTQLENYIAESIQKMTSWTSVLINSKKSETALYFSMLVDNQQVIIPVEYLRRMQ